MDLYFVRHGETDYNVVGRIQGGMDIPLNSKGLEQAQLLGQKCIESAIEFDAIFTSPKRRAYKTAEIVSQQLGLTYQVLDGIEEINLGEWQGLTWQEVKDNFKEDYDNWFMHRRRTKATGGESYQEMIDRVIKALRKVINSNYDNVLVVTHSAVIMCLICLIEEIPFEKMSEHKPGNGEMVKFDEKALANIT